MQPQINAIKHDSWELLYRLLSSTAVFCTATKVPPSTENGDVEQIIVTGTNGGETIHCLTLVKDGIKAKIRDIDEEMFFEFGKVSELVDTLSAN